MDDAAEWLKKKADDAKNALDGAGAAVGIGVAVILAVHFLGGRRERA